LIARRSKEEAHADDEASIEPAATRVDNIVTNNDVAAGGMAEGEVDTPARHEDYPGVEADKRSLALRRRWHRWIQRRISRVRRKPHFFVWTPPGRSPAGAAAFSLIDRSHSHQNARDTAEPHKEFLHHCSH